MQVKFISVDTNSYFFHRLAEALEKQTNEWLSENNSIDVVSITPTYHNAVVDDVIVMTATIIYN